jgi:hypothetical protein
MEQQYLRNDVFFSVGSVDLREMLTKQMGEEKVEIYLKRDSDTF